MYMNFLRLSMLLLFVFPTPCFQYTTEGRERVKAQRLRCAKGAKCRDLYKVLRRKEWESQMNAALL